MRRKKLSPGTLILFIFSVFMLLPILWLIITSLKTYPETVGLPVALIPKSFKNLDNYKELFSRLNFLTFFKNNIIVTVGIVFPQLFLSSLAGYAFARIDFPFKNIIFISLLVALMVPTQMILMPRYNLIIKLGWADSFWGIIIPGIPSIATTFFIRQQIMSLPKSLDESAYMDGANHWTIYHSIIMPLCQSALLATGVMCLVFAWNDFLWPLIVLNSTDKYVLSIAVANLQGQHLTKDNQLAAAGLIVSLPIIIIFFFCQKYFIEGIAMSGIKE
jgi:multiple sugar transport system permease protein